MIIKTTISYFDIEIFLIKIVLSETFDCSFLIFLIHILLYNLILPFFQTHKAFSVSEIYFEISLRI